MQNLTTMDLVDVILHTRVPPGRLVDWIDQAFLLIHLEQAARSDLKQLRQPKPGPNCVHHIHGSLDGIEAMTGAQARVALRRVGIRTATDLLKAFSIEQPPAQGRVVGRCFHATAVGEPLPPVQLRLLVHILAAEPGLAAVWNWQRNGVVLRAENISGR